MVNKTNNNTAEINKNRSSINFSPKTLTEQNSLKDSLINDDLIISLAEAYENKRVRQVTEWERMQRRNFLQAA